MPSFFFLSLMNGAAWGGSEELWYQTALFAAARGHKVGCAFYEWKEKEERIAALEGAGCRVYLLPNRGRKKENTVQKLQYKISRWKVRQKIASLPFRDYDLTVINQGGLEVLTTTWKKANRFMPAYALLFHNYNEEDRFRPSKAELLRQWLRGAALNLFASSRIPLSLEEKLSIKITNAGFFLNPITIDPPAAPSPYPALREPCLFVMLAELDTTRKAQDNLLEALAKTPWKQRSWQLHLYGAGNDKALLQGLIEGLGLAGKVDLKGHTAQVKEVLQRAHLVLQITHRDAMPLVVVEAMAMARPLVVSHVGDMPQWVEEGRNGWIAKDASVAEIDAALEKAWQQKEHWQQAGIESFHRFREKFPPSVEGVFLQQLMEVIK